MEEAQIPTKYYSLSQLANSLQSMIRKTYSQHYWIKAEIVRLNFYPKSGHCYPDLVEKDGAKVLAQMRGIIWSSDYFRMNADFVKKTGKALSDGMEILFRAKVEYSPVHGLSLIINDISAEFVLGKMALEKKHCIERLKKEGLFNQNKQRNLALIPQRIAIVSVETSKGFQDFINIIDNNSRGYKFFWMLFPALLQGDGAVSSIMQQLEQIRNITSHFDLVAIIRGGGGDVGLSCYDHYDLAKAIAEFPIPVLSGIGHSTNETVSEMVAHYNPITPTDLAYFLQQKFDNVAVNIEEHQQFIIDESNRLLLDWNYELSDISKKLSSSTRTLLESQLFQINSMKQEVQHSSKFYMQSLSTNLTQVQSKLQSVSLNRLNSEPQKQVAIENRLQFAAKAFISKKGVQLNHLEDVIKLMSPESLLKKGYSLTLHHGKPIKDIKDLKEGDEILTQFFKGEVDSRVIKIRNNE